MSQAWFVDERSGVRMPDGLMRVPVDRCIIAPWNPNKQDPATFKTLVDAIREDGFIDIPQVAPLTAAEDRAEYLDASCDEGDYWLIIGGAHRKDAAKMLDMAVWPVIEIAGWSADVIKMRNMRLNTLKGKIDPERFLKLHDELKAKGYGDDLLKHQMGLVQRNAMKKLIRAATKDLPTDVKRMVEERADEIETVDDLGRVLKELLSKHGDTLPWGYMVFEFGKKTNYWVRMDRQVKEAVDRLATACLTCELDINRVFAALLTDKDTVDAAFALARTQAAADDDVFA